MTDAFQLPPTSEGLVSKSQQEMLFSLAHLSRIINPAGPTEIEDVFLAVAPMLLHFLAARSLVLAWFDAELHVLVTAGDQQSHLHALALSPSQIHLLSSDGGTLRPLVRSVLEVLPIPLPLATSFSVLLQGNGEFFGLIEYAKDTVTVEDRLLVEIIGHHLSLALHAHALKQSVGQQQQQIITRFFETLVEASKSGMWTEELKSRARQLGVDLTIPHVLAMFEVIHRPVDTDVSTFLKDQGAVGRLLEQITARWPTALLMRQEQKLVALVPVTDMKLLKSQIQGVLLTRESIGTVVTGVGSVCRTIEDYHRGMREAEEAFQFAIQQHPMGGVTFIEEVGVLRWLRSMEFMEHDPSMKAIQLIESYGQSKGTDLLTTLEVYLKSNADIAKTAANLSIHRNTVQQRIDRIETLLHEHGFEMFTESGGWADLLISIRAYRLRPSPH